MFGKEESVRSVNAQVKHLAFICHYVTDIARARRFYEDVLGLRVAVEYEGAPGKWWIEYDVGGVTFAIKNFDRSGGGGGAVPAFEVADLDAAYAVVRAANVTISEALGNFPRCRHFGVRDPDGNEMIIHQLKSTDEVPRFDPALARTVTPYLHGPTGRTVGHRQPATDGRMHLFSPDGFFVVTE